jgi:PAS domain S-box-containing protein
MSNLADIDDGLLFKTMFNVAAEGLVVVDQTGEIKLVNSRITELFGFTGEELLNAPVEILVPEMKREAHKQHRKSYMDSPKMRHMGLNLELAGARKDGSQFPIEVSLNHFTANGMMYVMAMITDISIRKRAERELNELNSRLESIIDERTRELQDSQNLFRSIARNFPQGTINVFDRNLNYIFVEGEDLYKAGITSERLVGTNYIRHLPAEIREHIQRELQTVFNGGIKSLEISIPKGTYLLNCVPLTDVSGNINRILVVEQNISRQKKAEEEVRKALQREKELSELKSRFVSMASHEFRTPLSTILSSADLIARYSDAQDQEKRKKHVERVRSSVKQLTSILNDFLSLSKLEEGKVSLNPEKLDIQNFCEELRDEMQEIAKENQHIVYEHNGDVEVILDPQHLKTIAINLLSNAIKYSPHGGRIRLISSVAGGKLTLEIEDEGIGIPEEEQSKLFERFFRANNATNIQGTGLGLNIVQRYAELSGGLVSFRSEPGKGSVFTVTLPQYLRNEKENTSY